MTTKTAKIRAMRELQQVLQARCQGLEAKVTGKGLLDTSPEYQEAGRLRKLYWPLAHRLVRLTGRVF